MAEKGGDEAKIGASSKKVLAGVVKETFEAFRRLGVDECQLIQESGVRLDELQDPDSFVDFAPLAKLWQCAIKAFPRREIGMYLGRATAQRTVEALGAAGYASLYAPTIRERFEFFIAFAPLSFPTTKLTLEEVEGLAHLHIETDTAVRALVEPVESFLSVLVTHYANMNADMPPIVGVRFAHARKHARSTYEAYFDAPIEFNAMKSGLTFEARVLDFAVTNADARLSKLLHDQARRQLQIQLALQDSSAAEVESLRVQENLARLLPKGQGSCANVARAMGLSARTLQRRLENQKTSFHEIVENYRHSQAKLLLAHPSNTVAQVAQALGYENPRVFYRSFRRWTSQSPGEYRRQVASRS
jgi:AraC-like DNA-binding protein